MEYARVSDQDVEGEGLLAGGPESDFGEEDLRETYVRNKNWPVCKPFLHHSIARDVDDPRLQHAVRVYYYLWYSLSAAFVINTLAVGAAFFAIAEAHWSNWIGLILSLVYFAVCWPLSFVVYYYLAYEGARLRSSVKMGTFFCAFPAQIVVCAWLALGIPKTGGGGLVLLVHAWESGEMSTAVLNVVAMLVWIFLGLGSAYVLFLMWRAFRAVQASGLHSRGQTERTSIEDDDARDSFIDVEEETSTVTKAKESESPSSSGFSSWSVPAKLNLSLPASIRRERPETTSSASVDTYSPPAPAAAAAAAAAKYDLPTNFLE
jgi:hypothetical protein